MDPATAVEGLHRAMCYFSFTCAEAMQGVKAYLQERTEHFGALKPDEPLFCSAWTL